MILIEIFHTYLHNKDTSIKSANFGGEKQGT